MIALITMVALISSYLLANVLTRTSTEVKLDNDQRTRNAMLEAKAALIAYAAAQAWGNDGANDQPGSLPCPSLNEAGTAGNCTAAATAYLGRLPWETLRTTNFKDGSGALLWYGLSPNFKKHAGTTVINSDTLGTLSVTGSAPASAVVAVVIAPGPAIGGQSRTSSSAASTYLEGDNATASGTGNFVTAQSSDTFNDQIVTITQAELMAAVEPAVAARIQRDVKGYLTSYYNLWGKYPFPVAFSPGPGNSSSRAQSSYLGSSSATEGLLPIADAAYSWVTGLTGLVTRVSGSGSISGTPSCFVSTNYWRCTIAATGPNCVSGCSASMNINVDGQVSNAGLSLAKFTTGSNSDDFMHPASNVTVTAGGTFSFTANSIGISLLNTGNALVRFNSTINYTYTCASSFLGVCFSQTPRTVTVTIRQDPAYIVSSGVSSSDPTDGWFISNQWYRQTYYAVAPAYLPGGSGSCTPGSDCLTVGGLDQTTYPGANTDKRALLVFMGHSLNGTARPSATLVDYLEGDNASTGDRTFRHFSSAKMVTGGVTSTVNDRAVVIAP